MSEPTIKCPNCGNEFPLDAAFREHFDREKQEAIAGEKIAADARIAELLLERDKIHEGNLQRTREEAEEQAASHFREQTQALEEAQYQLSRTKRQLTERDEDHKRDLRRTREEVEEETGKRHRQELRDKDIEVQGAQEEIRRLGNQLETLRRRTRQGSMELQGEALETWLKQQLQAAFSQDSIEDVKKGQRGADLVQQVINPRGQRCGVVLWETKNAQNWSKGWLDKIHGDAERVGADLKVIVSAALPDGIKSFGFEDGVWVSSIESAPALGAVLRQQLLQLYNLKRANIGREGKMEAVYAYLVGEQFRDRVERIVSTWEALRNQVDAEERAMQRQWKERRKQLNIMIDVTTDMYTDISAIIGAEQLPEVGGLSISALPSGEEEREVS
ncbi:MAG: DUF2130 domain-containing protein [Anaerolineaceae bacterium]|nr:DUF2130 domain-containing protein [Anaerolineaceae bacterium]